MVIIRFSYDPGIPRMTMAALGVEGAEMPTALETDGRMGVHS